MELRTVFETVYTSVALKRAFVVLIVLYLVYLVQLSLTYSVTVSVDNARHPKAHKKVDLLKVETDVAHCLAHVNLSVIQPKPAKDYYRYLVGNYPGSTACVEPVDNSDLPKIKVNDPQFNCTTVIKQISAKEKAQIHRKQLEITCSQSGESRHSTKSVPFLNDLQTFTTPADKACLQLYIRQHCTDFRPVPDVIHLLWFGNDEDISFRSMLGLYSIFTIAKPALVVLHSDFAPRGQRWEAILPVATYMVRVHKNPTRTTLNGKPIKEVQNMADIGRIEVLLEYGGIYLDSDMVLTRKLDIFREATFAASKAGSSANLANGAMFSEPNSTVLQDWMELWNTYDGTSWNSHSTLMLTQLACAYPELVSALGPVLIKFGWEDTDAFYNQECSLGESHSAHLYRRGYPEQADMTLVRTERSTFGRLARYVLFGDPNVCAT